MFLNNTIASLRTLQFAFNTAGFRNWMNKHHNIKDLEPFFLGHRYFLEVCLIQFIDEIAEDTSLELTEDETFQFAQSAGLLLDEIPNTCDKVVVLKNIWSTFEPILEAQSWNELEIAIHKANDIISIFSEIFKNISPNEKNVQNNWINLATLNYVHTQLNDTSRLKPLGSVIGLVKSSVEELGSEHFTGYAFTLEYLWYLLLDKEIFEKSSAKYIHNPHDILSEADYQRIKESYFSTDEPEDQKGRIAWIALDHLYCPLFEGCIHPYLKEYDPREPVFFVKEYDRQLLDPLLDRTRVREPYYLLDQSDEESWYKTIDYNLRWLSVGYIDTGGVHDCFGTYALIPFLLGLRATNRPSESDKIEILRIRHPEIFSNGYAYSYAILNNARFFDDNGLGWIFFLNCGNDVSGHGGEMYRTAEQFIKNLEHEKILKIRQIDLDIDILQKYLKERADTIFNDPNLPIESIILSGESDTIEFKSSLLWDHPRNAPSKILEYQVAKSIAAFLNSNGGTLLIGINAAREVIGLEKDYTQLGAPCHQNQDGFERRLNEVVTKYLGKIRRHFMDVKFEFIDGKDVCRVYIFPAEDPVFLKNNDEPEIYVRTGNTSTKLKINEFYEYLKKHWGIYKK